MLGEVNSPSTFSIYDPKHGSKIKEISKLNFKSTPSLKLSGKVIDILDYL